MRWANVQAIDVKFSQDVTHRKSLKSVNFWDSCLKNKKVEVFLGHSVVTFYTYEHFKITQKLAVSLWQLTSFSSIWKNVMYEIWYLHVCWQYQICPVMKDALQTVTSVECMCWLSAYLWQECNDVHGDSIIGRKVTDAVICRITLWISFFTSASSFCLPDELLTAQKSTRLTTLIFLFAQYQI